MNGRIFMIMALPLLMLAVGDIGPPPPYTHFTIQFIENGEQYAGPVWAVYHCQNPEVSPGDGPLETVEVELECSSGVCTNGNWFYKFNPCYDWNRGYIKYKISQESDYLSTGLFIFSEENSSFSVDIDSGKIRVPEEKGPAPEICPVLTGILFSAVFFSGRTLWN